MTSSMFGMKLTFCTTARLNHHHGQRGLRCSDRWRPLHMPRAGLISDTPSARTAPGWSIPVQGGDSWELAPWRAYVSSEARLGRGTPEPQKSAMWTSYSRKTWVLCGASTGHCMLASVFFGGISGQLVAACRFWYGVKLPSQPAAAAGCERAELLCGPGLSSRAPPPRTVLLIACPSLPVPPLWGRTPEGLVSLPLSLCASVSGLS